MANTRNTSVRMAVIPARANTHIQSQTTRPLTLRRMNTSVKKPASSQSLPHMSKSIPFLMLKPPSCIP